MDSYESLFELISGIIPLNKEDNSLIKSAFVPLSVKRDDVLINTGDYADTAFYVVSGYLRYYKYLETGEEQTIHIVTPGDFAAAFCSFVENVPSDEILHAVTDAELLAVRRRNLEKLYSSDMKWQMFGRKLMEMFLLEKEKRIISLLSLPAQERYLRIIESNPKMLQNVPVQYLASYIGIKPESLSRIRKQIG
jgi:CRP-like cAMP-binding protein